MGTLGVPEELALMQGINSPASLPRGIQARGF